MIIREFNPGEEDILRGVFFSSVHTLAAGFYTLEQINAWAPAGYNQQAWKKKLIRLRPFVALLEGQIVGYASLGQTGYIDHFFVSGKFSRCGVGLALMNHIYGVADSRALAELSAEVSLAAESFFLKHGFVIAERQSVSVRGEWLKNARMVKALAASESVAGIPS